MTSGTHDWDGAYQQPDGAPWDIGRPQPAFRELAEQGALTGALLDSGCGTGENGLLAASCGATVLGVDLSPTAIARATAKAAERGLDARFAAGNVLEMSIPTDAFDTVIDSGLFHSFDDDDRPRYVEVLRRATKVGGTFYLMCFSDRQPGDWGPRRVTDAEIRAAFADGWTVERIDPSRFDVRPSTVEGFAGTFAEAWLSTIRRT